MKRPLAPNCGIHAWPLCRPKVIVTMIYSLQKKSRTRSSRNPSYWRARWTGPDANLSLSKNLNYWPFCAHFLSYYRVARWVFTEPINSLSYRGLFYLKDICRIFQSMESMCALLNFCTMWLDVNSFYKSFDHHPLNSSWPDDSASSFLWIRHVTEIAKKASSGLLGHAPLCSCLFFEAFSPACSVPKRVEN